MKVSNKALVTPASNNHLHFNNTPHTFRAQSLKRISELAVQKRHWCMEQSFGLCGRGRGWDDLGEWHWNMYNIRNKSPVQVRCMILDAWGWCTGMTQRDGMGMEEERDTMTSAFSWQNSVSLWPASFCTPRTNLSVTPGVSWLPNFAVQSPIRKRTSFLGVSSRRSCKSS